MLKKIIGAVIGLSLFLPLTVSAHTVNQPPFIDVDGVPTGYYNVGYSSLPTLKLPQDNISTKVVVGDTVKFHIIQGDLPILPEEIQYIDFHWDLGDGTTYDGTDLTHVYKKAGPIVFTLTSHDTRTTDAPQVLDIVLINVLPNANYVLPKAIMSVNGEVSTNFTKDIIQADFSKKILLDGSQSVAGTSKIVSYTWDLGDEQMSSGSKVTHLFESVISKDWPVLRVTDALGFYSDTSAQIANAALNPAPVVSSTPAASQPTHRRLTFEIIGGVVAVLALGGVLSLVARTKRKVQANDRTKNHHAKKNS